MTGTAAANSSCNHTYLAMEVLALTSPGGAAASAADGSSPSVKSWRNSSVWFDSSAVSSGSQRSASALYRSCLFGCLKTEDTCDRKEVPVVSSWCGSQRTAQGP